MVEKQEIRERISCLRKRMAQEKIAACIIPSDDYHGSEYVGRYFRCREYFSGFTGSAGTLVIAEDMAGLWTDGRYFLQAEQQLSDTGIELFKMQEEGVPSVQEFLQKKYSGTEKMVAVDGRTLSMAKAFAMEKGFRAEGILFCTEKDLPGEVWEETGVRPALPACPVWELEECYSGKSCAEKLHLVYEKMEEKKADILLISSLDDIAWLLNLRGDDIEYVPVFLAYALVMVESNRTGQNLRVQLYVQRGAFSKQLEETLEKQHIFLQSYEKIYCELAELVQEKTVWIDQKATNAALGKILTESGCKLVKRKLPTQYMKAVKNPTEQEKERQAHKKDGIAFCKFLYWLKRECPEGLTEIEAADKLERLRAEQEHYIEPSFAPISAYKEHGAVVHYSATEETNAVLNKEGFLLLDTGAHYLEGTTDITRTISMGRLSQQQKKHYTAVLKGNLALGDARFLYGCTGINLDILARQPLWELGLDFNHGTGHGVGYLLNVHEGPNRIGMRVSASAGSAVMEEGMITSNEPGYYLAGQYGIRLENMILCKKAEKTEAGQFMRFETLTLVPFEREAVLKEDMTPHELTLFNAYHKRVYKEISPFLNENERQWLREATAKL